MFTRVKPRFLLTLTLLLTVLAACENLSRMKVAGNYVNEKDSKSFMDLKSNGAFFLREHGMGVAGTYEVDGDQITMKTDMGMADRGKIEGKTIIDGDGERWTKP